MIASPLARRLAKENGSDLRAIRGSGPGGRIIKADVLAALAVPRRAPAVLPNAARNRLSAICGVEALLDICDRLNGPGPQGMIAIADFAVRAAGLALTKSIAVKGDIALAVEREDRFVSVPIRDAGRKGLAAIAAERTRTDAAPAVEPDETFMAVVDLTPHGIEAGEIFLSNPCVLTLGTPLARGMTCTLSADAKALDGLAATRFLGAFKRLLEAPQEMLL